MIQFNVIRWKNFLSTGDVFTEIKLNEQSNALIVGENGAGKSTVLDALTFCLFGKAFRKINKSGLVNSVNEKCCVTEIEFDTNGKNYKIVRGIKPNLFEIYCDGTLLNQDSASRDYQDHLEKFILKMNYKSFTQIVILGSASFTPFMQMAAADRRVVIEDLLDIQIFSVMNVIAKQKLQTNKTDLEKNRFELIAAEDKKTYIEKTLSSLKQNNEDKKNQLDAQITDQKTNLKSIELDIENLEKERESLLSDAIDQSKLRDKHRKLLGLQAKIEVNLSNVKAEHNFYCDNDSCPTCRQDLESSFKVDQLKAADKKISDFEDGLSKIGVEIDAAINSINDADRILKKIENIRNDITTQKSKANHVVSMIDNLEKQIDRINSSDNLLKDNEVELEKIRLTLAMLTDEKVYLLTERQFIDTSLNLLKDGGIKTKIVKQYLPIINKHINKYLSQMGFFVNFNIDESFSETIKSRYRDEFSYHNFSEGEKTRIDLALLFTWRSIAKMRNSVNTNLLILDEVLDGSLDVNGTDEFLKIMWSMIGDTNTFVISHKTDVLIDKFQKVHRFSKVKNFSRLI